MLEALLADTLCVEVKRQTTLETSNKFPSKNAKLLTSWVLQANRTFADEKKCGSMGKDLFAETCMRTSERMPHLEHQQTEQ